MSASLGGASTRPIEKWWGDLEGKNHKLPPMEISLREQGIGEIALRKITYKYRLGYDLPVISNSTKAVRGEARHVKGFCMGAAAYCLYMSSPVGGRCLIN